MKVALVCDLLLCLLMIVIGVLFIFAPISLIEKCILVPLFILSGIALGNIGIEFWRDDL